MSAHHIGKYDVLGELGVGGMAVVYRAHDPALDRDVAIKVLHPHLARDAESRMRFEREARAAARLRHPNIVEVYEFSNPDDDNSYLVTELLQGPTIRRFFELHPDAPAEVIAALGVVLCDALACAHKQGVIHRDVKPDNLMLQTGGEVKLTDFGIAHVADQREVTVTGQVLGSPAHMAPEQIEGAAVDARTDLFAAGTVLYLLGVGRLPFEGPTAHALLRKILEGDFVDPIRAAPQVGHRFAQIVRKAMAHVPADRYPDAGAMRADLVVFLDETGWGDPVKGLHRYFDDPSAFMAQWREVLIAKLPELGVAARRRGDLVDAAGYFNRALAIDPGNARVLALARSAARRRQLERVARTVGIISAAAMFTAAGVYAFVQNTAPPRPVVTPLPSHDEVPEPTEPTVPRVRVTETAVPDASVVEAVTEDAGETPSEPRVRRPVRDHGTVATAPSRAAHEAATVVMRDVKLAPFPPAVVYSINGGPARRFRSQESTTQLPVGQPATIVFTPDDPSYERGEWRGVIPPGDGEFPVRIRLLHADSHRDGTAQLP